MFFSRRSVRGLAALLLVALFLSIVVMRSMRQQAGHALRPSATPRFSPTPQPTQTPQASPIIVVVAQQILFNGNVVYSYTVKNNNAPADGAAVSSFSIGSGPDENELSSPPLGWAVGSNSVPHASATMPTGWSVEVWPQEESNMLDIEWYAGQGVGLAPGQVGRFSIVLPRVDATYQTSHWVCSMNGGGSGSYYGTLVPGSAVGE